MVMEKPHPFCPRIYYLHPLLAGALTEWGTHLDRCAELGFDHVLVAPIFAPGRVGDIFLTGDTTRPHTARSAGTATRCRRSARRWSNAGRADCACCWIW